MATETRTNQEELIHARRERTMKKLSSTGRLAWQLRVNLCSEIYLRLCATFSHHFVSVELLFSQLIYDFNIPDSQRFQAIPE